MRDDISNARWLRNLAVAGAMLGLVGVGACKDDLTAPAVGPDFHFSGGGHHDLGHHWGRGSGRSGSAAMTAVAELGRDGRTVIVVTTYRASDVDFTTPVGCIKSVQVKVLNGDRHHDDDDRTWTRNHIDLDSRGSYTVRLNNVRPGARIKVRVLVGCIDGRRIDVVVATATVETLPDPTALERMVVDAIVSDDTVDYNDTIAVSQRLYDHPSVLRDTMYSRQSTVGNVQSASFTGTIYESVTFPLVSFSASQSTGGTTYHTGTWTAVRSDGGASAELECADLSAGPVTLLVCSYLPDGTFPHGRTVISYVRSDTSATTVEQAYHVLYGSTGTPSLCDPTSSNDAVDGWDPCYTIRTPRGPALLPYQRTYTFTVVLETATRRYASLVTIPLSSAPLVASEPGTCTTVNVTGGDGVPLIHRACQGVTDVRARNSGLVSGFLGLTQAK